MDSVLWWGIGMVRVLVQREIAEIIKLVALEVPRVWSIHEIAVAVLSVQGGVWFLCF